MHKTELKPFEQALLDTSLEEFADIPAEEELELELSAAFEEKGAELIARVRRGNLRKVSTTVRRIILIAAIIAALAVSAMAVPSIREGIIRFFATNAGTHYEFSFDPEQAATAPEYIEKVYKPTYIPEGFYEDTAFIDIGCVVYIWYSESGDYISFDQLPIPNDSEGPQPDAEDVEVETLNLNGYEVFAVYSDGFTLYHWTDNEYFYVLALGPSVTNDECIKVFYSIGLDEEAVIPES